MRGAPPLAQHGSTARAADGAPKVHIVGAGLSGLACAVRLARQGRQVALYEAAAQAGGRCRSYHDAKLDRWIDNGNHILLSANTAALSYLEEIGAADSVTGPEEAIFPFVDLASGERWTLHPNRGPLPWWIFDRKRRVAGTRPRDYLDGLRLARAKTEDRVGDCLDRSGPLWQRLWEPLTVAALNTAPREASAQLMWRVVKETFARGGRACLPRIAKASLSDSFIEPALTLLREHGGELHFNQRLRGIAFGQERAQQLDFGELQVDLAPRDWLVVALPPPVAGALLPGLGAPADSRPIVNAHIRLPAWALEAIAEGPLAAFEGKLGIVPYIGMVGGSADWIFLRGDVASLTVSAAERLADEPAEDVAAKMWADTAAALGIAPRPSANDQPVIRVIKEKRATFAQTPEALKRRSPTHSRWSNLLLAGDWTATGYPATIESSVRSGRAAAAAILKQPVANI